jgi:hypothetical protein
MASSIQEEIEYIRKNLPPQTKLITANTNFVTAVCEKTASRSIKVTLTIPSSRSNNDNDESSSSSYPCIPLIVSIDTQQKNGKTKIPPGLKKKLENQLTKVAEEEISPGTFGQIHAVLVRLQIFVDTNRFVPCWKELKQSMDLISSSSSTTTKKGSSRKCSMSILSETKGMMKVQFEMNNDYKYACKITIDEGYPTTLSIHDWGKSSFIQTIPSGTNMPNELFTYLTNQAQQFVRLLQDGMPEKEARCYIHQTNTGGGVPMITEDGHQVPKYDGSNSQLSLLPLVQYLIDTIPSVFDHICPKCEKSIFPSDSQTLKSLYIKKKKIQIQKLCPIQSYCGCWYHYGCLQQVLLEPPFGDACSNDIDDGCGGRQVGHKIFFSDDDGDNNNIGTRDEREKMWQMEQRQQRELDDMAMMF